MLRRLLQHYIKPPPVEHRHIVGSYNGYTLAEWQSSTAHINWMRDMMGVAKFRDMLAVLSNARPSATLSHITDIEAAVALGRRIGYDEVLGLILSLTSYPEREAPPVDADYGASEFDLKKTV